MEHQSLELQMVEPRSLSGGGVALAFGAEEGLEVGRAWDGSDLSVAADARALALGADVGATLLYDVGTGLPMLKSFFLMVSHCCRVNLPRCAL